MNNTIWNYYQNENKESFKNSYKRLNYILKKLLQLKRKKVLNIGVGNAYFESMAISKKIEIFSLDPDDKSIRELQSKIGKNAKVGSIEKIPFPNNFFDAVVVSEVLEHLSSESIKIGLSEINRVLNENGIIIGTVPYKENLIEQMIICPKCAERFHRWGHLQSFDNTKLQIYLKNHFYNLKIEEKFFIPWKELNWKGKLLNIIKLMLNLIGVEISDKNIFFIAYKK